MRGENVGVELSNDGHLERVGFVPFSEVAVERVREIVPPRSWMGRRRFPAGADCDIGCEEVLVFGFFDSRPAAGVALQLPDLDPQPFEKFLHRAIDRTDRWKESQFEFHRGDLRRFRCLAWLARQLHAPAAIWDHAGCEGLDREFAFGFDPAGNKTMEFFNDTERQPDTHPPDRPRSALTACLWHIGARAPNWDESAYGHELHAFESIGN